MLDIQPIKAFSDNYIWLFREQGSPTVGVVDPGDAAPVIDVLEAQGLTLSTILITHHHFDHVGGLAALKERYSPAVYGPVNPSVDGIDHALRHGDRIEVFGTTFEIMEIPGHTLDHIAYAHTGESPLVFCGDTLFAGGCGRVFEGDPPMMLRSLDTLAELPDDSRVYCAHEYTLANLAFAAAVEPDNAALQARITDAEATRARGEPTVPSELRLELATNPFLRCRNPQLIGSLNSQGKLAGERPDEVFAAVRGWKDNF